MSGMQGSFDASQFKPSQGGEGHPVGNKFPFVIVGTSIEPTKDQTGGMFIVEFETPAGRIKTRYNLFNQSPKAVEIAHGQLSALCHAIGIFRIDYTNEGAAIRGGRGQLDVGYQKGEEPTAENPKGGYVEVKRVYDANGNEPGKAPAAAPQPQQPAQAQPQWGTQAPADNAGAAPSSPPWGR